MYFYIKMCLTIYPLPFFIVSPQEANNLDKNTTKAESARLFRMWYGFDHKYPLIITISQILLQAENYFKLLIIEVCTPALQETPKGKVNSQPNL